MADLSLVAVLSGIVDALEEVSWTAALSGIAGIAVGAVLNAYLRYRADRAAARKELVEAIGVVADQCIAAVIDLHAVVVAGNNSADRWKAIAQYRREYASVIALEVRVFREFKDRRVRAGFRKITNRLERFRNLVADTEPVPDAKVELAQSWVEKQLSDTISFASTIAGINLTDPSRPIFIGFRRVTRQDRKVLSFGDEPAPWEFHMETQVGGMEDKDSQAFLAHNKPKVESLMCTVHNRPAHIYFVGHDRSNIAIELETCCEEFARQVEKKLAGGRKNDGLREKSQKPRST